MNKKCCATCCYWEKATDYFYNMGYPHREDDFLEDKGFCRNEDGEYFDNATPINRKCPDWKEKIERCEKP